MPPMAPMLSALSHRNEARQPIPSADASSLARAMSQLRHLLVIRPTLHPGGALQSLRLSHDKKKGPLAVLAGCIWLANIKQAHHIAELVSVCDLRESKRIDGDAIAVSVVDAARAIANAARRLGMTIVPHDVLLARVR